MPFFVAAGLIVGGICLLSGATYAGVKSSESGNSGWSLAGDIALGGLVWGISGFAFGAWAGVGISVFLAGSFFATSTAVFSGASLFGQMLTVGGIEAALLMVGDNFTNSIHYKSHIFWSGGDIAKDIASELANQVGGITLNMTRLGSYLTNIGASRQVWEIASKNFANQVHQNGIVRAILYYPLMESNSLWFIERDILIKKMVEIIIGGH